MIMKKHYESTVKGGGTSYSAPIIDKTKCAGIQNQMRLFGG